MASVSYYRDRKGKKLTRIQFVDRDGHRKTIYLGKASKRDVDAIKPRVESLVSAQHAGHIPDEDMAKWVAKLSKPLAKKLAGVGLVKHRWEAVNQAGETVLTMEGWGMYGRRPA